jgi:hypothetical protein
MGKKVVTASKDASWARLPVLDKIAVLQCQLFDNRKTAEGVKGRSDFALKLFAWTSQWNISFKQPEWWRVIQLIEPKTVLSWARKKREAGDMTQGQFDLYESVCANATEAASGDAFEFVKMGHIASPPGTQYFIGQFVVVYKNTEGAITTLIINGDDVREIGPDRWKQTRKAGRYRKPGTPTHSALYDPSDIFGRQDDAARKLADYQASKGDS